MKHVEHRLSAIMFTDIVGFSRMMEEDEKGTLSLLDYHNTLVEETVKSFRGKVIKTIGDAFLVDFPTAVDAMECAIKIQRTILEKRIKTPGEKLSLRIGIHLGDIYFYENDALGEGINIASRLQSIAEPDRIIISQEVFSQVSKKVEMRTQALGQVKLKNISQEVLAYEVIPAIPKEAQLEADLEEIIEKEQESKGFETSSQKEGAPHKGQQPPLDAEEIKDFIFTEMKRAGQRFHVEDLKRKIPRHWGNMDRILDKLASRGYLAGGSSPAGGKMKPLPRHIEERISGGFHPPQPPRAPKPFRMPWERTDSKNFFEDYKRKTLHKYEKAREARRGKLASLLGFSAALVFINLATSAGYPWFYYPVGFFSFLYISAFFQYRVQKQEAEHLKKLGQASGEELYHFREYYKTKKGFVGHTTFALGISAFVIGINLLHPAGVFYGGIVAALLMIPWLGHWSSFNRKMRKVRSALREMGSSFFSKKGKSLGTPVFSGEKSEVLQRAEGLHKEITGLLKGVKKSNPYAGEVKLLLTDYVDQLTEMENRGQEVDEIISSIPVDALKVDKAKLKAKLEVTESDYLKKEYQKSIDEIERQENSCSKLKEQREVIDLRINSAVNALNQMKLDMARMKTMSQPVGGGNLGLLRDRSREMAEYLNDYQDGLDELN